MTRRQLLPAVLAGFWPRRATGAPPLDLAAIPNCCSHEHWGSIASIGSRPQGYTADLRPGALPSRRTGLLDILADPYWRGWIASGGGDLDALAGAKFADLAERDPWDAFVRIQPVLRRHRFTGVIQCVRRGVLQLYGADPLALDKTSFHALDGAIDRRYRSLFGWYRNVMAQANFRGLIRPVQPEFYTPGEPSAAAREEAAFTQTVLRIDPFLDLWRTESPRRETLARVAGVEPEDAASWRRFLERWFELAEAGGAAGTKQLQAYRRPLEFLPREDREVKFRGALVPAEARVLEDWVVHECSRLAHERSWPHQVHVGTNNIGESSPLPLRSLAARYPKMPVVMIHCWPFLDESGWLAKFVPNIFIDTCWQPVLNPEFFRKAISTWWNYVPLHKITCGHDSTSVEMAVGSSLFTREILAEVIPERSRASGAGVRDMTEAASALLHVNAERLYGGPRRQA